MSLGSKFAASSFWVLLGNAGNTVVSLVIFIILARLLDPGEIGLVAFALIFIDLGRVIVSGGLPEAVVQRSSWNELTASTCFWANIATSIAFMVIALVVLAPIISVYYEPKAGYVIASLAAIYVIDASRAIHDAKLRREFRYGRLAARTSIATAVAGAIGITAAILGLGVWSLVLQRLSNATVLTVLTWKASGWMPSWTFSFQTLKELSSFTLHLTPARLITIVTMKVAEFLIGIILGPVSVAYYRIGGRGLEAVAQLTVAPIQQVALSTFSRMKDEGAIGGAYGRVTRISAFFAAPVYLFAAVTASDFVLIVFGPQWALSGHVMTALALGVGSTSLVFYMQAALTAAGRTDLVLASTAASLIATIATTLVTVRYGVVAVAAGLTLLQYTSLPFRIALLSSALKLDWQRTIFDLMPSFIASIGMALIVSAIRMQFLVDYVPTSRFMFSVLAGAVTYVALLSVFARHFLSDTIGDIVSILPQALGTRLTLLRVSSVSWIRRIVRNVGQ